MAKSPTATTTSTTLNDSNPRPRVPAALESLTVIATSSTRVGGVRNHVRSCAFMPLTEARPSSGAVAGDRFTHAIHEHGDVKPLVDLGRYQGAVALAHVRVHGGEIVAEIVRVVAGDEHKGHLLPPQPVDHLALVLVGSEISVHEHILPAGKPAARKVGYLRHEAARQQAIRRRSTAIEIL